MGGAVHPSMVHYQDDAWRGEVCAGVEGTASGPRDPLVVAGDHGASSVSSGTAGQ